MNPIIHHYNPSDPTPTWVYQRFLAINGTMVEQLRERVAVLDGDTFYDPSTDKTYEWRGGVFKFFAEGDTRGVDPRCPYINLKWDERDDK